MIRSRLFLLFVIIKLVGLIEVVKITTNQNDSDVETTFFDALFANKYLSTHVFNYDFARLKSFQ